MLATEETKDMVIIYFAAYVLKKQLIRHMNSLFKNDAEKFVTITVTFAASDRDKFRILNRR